MPDGSEIVDENAGRATSIPAITIYQPWASLVIAGWKDYEFRRWDYRTKRHHIEGKRIAIHASARPIQRDEVGELLDRIARRRAHIKEAAVPWLGQVHLSIGMIPRSAVLGTAVLGKPIECKNLFGADSNRVEHHVWAWPLADIIRFEVPIPARGCQGFWLWRPNDF